MSFGRVNQQWSTFSRVWHILNADRQPPGKIAVIAANHLQGLHKPVYHPSSDVGDHVVIVNAKDIAFSGNKWEQKVFHSNTGRKKGRLMMIAAEVHDYDDTWILRRTIYRQLPTGPSKRKLFQRLHVFSDENVPDEIMENVSSVLKPPRRVPKGIGDYTQEEIDEFPKLFSLSADFLKR